MRKIFIFILFSVLIYVFLVYSLVNNMVVTGYALELNYAPLANSTIYKNFDIAGNMPGDVLIFYNVSIFDVESDSAFVDNMSIIIFKDKIYDIVHKDDFNIEKYVKLNSGLRVINATGLYIIPGLFDMHAHVAGVLKDSFNRSTSEKTLLQLLDYGITTIRNPGGPTEESVNLRDDISSETIVGPQLLTAGRVLNSPNVSIPFVEIKLDSVNDVREEVNRQSSLGVDFIKLYVGMTPDLVKTAIDESHRNKIKVIGHLYFTSWTEASSLGIDSLTHGVPVNPSLLSNADRVLFERFSGGPFSHFLWLDLVDINSHAVNETIDSLTKNNVYVDPTLGIYEVMVKGVSGEQHLWNKVLNLTQKMYNNGVNLLTGSDIPNFNLIPGKSLHNEMKLLVNAGIPPKEVIKIATKNGAEALGLSKETGAIEIGKSADLVILSSNPIENISNTLDIQAVINDGQINNYTDENRKS